MYYQSNTGFQFPPPAVATARKTHIGLRGVSAGVETPENRRKGERLGHLRGLARGSALVNPDGGVLNFWSRPPTEEEEVAAALSREPRRAVGFEGFGGFAFVFGFFAGAAVREMPLNCWSLDNQCS